jgi:hypothetical protein
VTYDSGGFAVSVAVADVNGDGKPDVVTANETSNTVGVLLGNGDGTFRAAVTYGTGGQAPTAIAVADVNGDGKPDLLVAKHSANSPFEGSIGVLLGNGDGTFQPVVTYSSGGILAISIVVADVNGDGRPDVAVANFSDPRKGGGSVGVLLGNGDGTFHPVVTYGLMPPGNISWVAVADVNGDGKPDLVVAKSSPGLGVLLGNGDGTFQSDLAYDSGGVCISVAVADVNGDGTPDLLATNYGSNTVGVLLGKGDETFQPVVTYSSGGVGFTSIVVADVNGDGKPDLVVANECGPGGVCTAFKDGVLGVLLGKGDGTFRPVVTYDAGGPDVLSVAVADVNGDGKPDLVTTCANLSCHGGAVSVLLNNAPFDTTPPVITLSAAPKVLWPPNGKMVRVTFSGTITDTGSGVNVNIAAYAVKDEYGEVQPKGAITLSPRGNYSFTLLLQASRLGTDRDGRRYTVTVQAKDNAGNVGSKTSAVIVPHDQGD